MSDTTNEETYLTVPWPTLCDACGHALARDAMTRTDLDAFIGFCPHTHTLALAFVGEINGTRAIKRWDVQSPLSHDEAIEYMNKMSPHAKVMENLGKPQLN